MRTRDQQRAIFAYEAVKSVPQEARDEYRTLVLGLGPLVLRSGLVTALAFLQRKAQGGKEHPATRLFQHLARAELPGLRAEPDRAAEQLCERARHLDLEGTMLATRELLKAVEWLKRAVEASFDEGG
ncbi:MAG: type III-B CRISPR module-associated protein Cmr5 [Polyangiaceae bacterium]|nr:type III-B CRISPR module-associated protein Cmr5 [Polyangiaceae bacterium]